MRSIIFRGCVARDRGAPNSRLQVGPSPRASGAGVRDRNVPGGSTTRHSSPRWREASARFASARCSRLSARPRRADGASNQFESTGATRSTGSCIQFDRQRGHLPGLANLCGRNVKPHLRH